MPDVSLSFKHGRTEEEARRLLADAASRARSQLGMLVQRAEWSPGGSSVRLSGSGFELDARVDAHEVHVVGTLPLLAALLGPALKQLLTDAFQKRLT